MELTLAGKVLGQVCQRGTKRGRAQTFVYRRFTSFYGESGSAEQRGFVPAMSSLSKDRRSVGMCGNTQKAHFLPALNSSTFAASFNGNQFAVG